jgi:D-aminoacyl-tRNA deacylase
MAMKNIAIVVSELDPAGINIRKNLVDNGGFEDSGETFEGEPIYIYKETRLYTTMKESIHADHLDAKIHADLIIFATKHQSAQGVHSLSVHVPGNWANADMGGKPKKLCIAPASYLKAGLLILTELARGLDYEVTVEATHHGPYLDTPCMFIEIGSSEEQWKDPKMGGIIAEAVERLIEHETHYPGAILLGGGHYNHEANKMLLYSGYAVGHICPKHNLEHVDEAMLIQAMERTLEGVEMVILDWKGLGSEKRRILDILEKKSIPFERSKRIEKKR